MTGECNNLRPIMYGPFRIMENIGTNAFCLGLSPHMHMYSIINVENLKIYEPPMIVDEVEYVQVPIVDDFTLEYLNEMRQDVILDRRTNISHHSDVEYL